MSKVYTTFRLDEKLNEELRKVLFQRRMSKQDAFTEATALWIKHLTDDSKGKRQDYPVAKTADIGTEFKNADERKWVTKLLRVLRSPHAKAITAVTENLEVFSLYCDMADREHGRVAQDAGAPALRRAKGSGKTA